MSKPEKVTDNDRQEYAGQLPVVEIFWTGGFDSTFRVVQLSRREVFIQPYYLSDQRQSEENELKAVTDIMEALKKHPDTRCVFGEPVYVSVEERKENADVREAYQKLREKEFFGTQYEWLGVYAMEHKGIELSIHEDDKAVLLINKYGKFKQVEDEIAGGYRILDREASSPYLAALFENYHFPLIDCKKTDMKAFYTTNGYEHIMDMTWFCYHPIHGKPCGICNPCMYTIEEGMKERFTKAALVRYHCKKWIKRIKP
ncbi:MAG: 7-cyano-7-deazaguanine synthase [Butyrivibrio sp.]|nr:7-cyano-7-deazaguanine synthase [Butyrivibrio sp.]